MSFKSLPSECYPLFGMLATGLGFGVYVASKHLLKDQELRLRPRPVGSLKSSWEERVTEFEGLGERQEGERVWARK
ncbi:uncharacterized protein SPPG_08851 [Spizellomyces punctatus DAOM BR117]|uniref:Uncharacterized protein n=1 Tax=Spizellomyces punctatus (strain DAOM BR117) TaxID=645134 RepID=A0A0L0HV37_SPIPD|nr:uncharacterized protein SPPG_08851 [Spizellomyces punctatus DAOM BR117]KND04760.1 hypothetical protein SPPG_08851 [Spizellomyces punctatus DAOM BR117]|eukprot:XP_016612799.1 hypothetical protein SPPG_08851 [Spizellomyces punctatus DAOM BR117]